MTIALDLPQKPRLRSSTGLPHTFIAGVLILAISTLIAFAPQLVSPYDPLAFDYKAILKAPTLAHPFGTDSFGRDMLSRVLSAYTIDMQIAVLSTIFPFLFGTLVGAVVGYYGGLAETILGRVVDAVITFPFLVLVIAIVSVLGPGLFNM